MLTNIRNSNLIRSINVRVPRTSLTYEISVILKQEGFIDYIDISSSNCLKLFLRYKGLSRKPYISGLVRVSTPGLRVYVRKNKIPQVFGGIGVAIRLFNNFHYLIIKLLCFCLMFMLF
jgi:small subunit ribosomal protein S8